MIDAAAAWEMLQGPDCLGVSTCGGAVQCFIRRDGAVECDQHADTDETEAFDSEAEFVAKHAGNRFTEIHTGCL